MHFLFEDYDKTYEKAKESEDEERVDLLMKDYVISLIETKL